MTNKFRGLQPLPVEQAQDTARQSQVGMDGGFRGDLTARQIPLNSTPDLMDIRFERSGIRKDFGWTPIGAAAGFPILGLIEHKYIDALLQFHRLVRVFRNGTNNAELQVWDGAAWVTVDTSVETILNVYLSIISAQSCVYMADGQQVLEWCEVLEKFPQEDDFPAGNILDAAGETAVATINPGSGAVLHYDINYDITFFSSIGADTLVILEFLHGAVVIGEVSYSASQFGTFPLIFENEVFGFERQIPLNDQVTIRVKEVEGGTVIHEMDLMANVTAGNPDVNIPDRDGPKTPATAPAVGNRYEFNYSFNLVSAVGSWDFSVDFFVQFVPGPWTKVGQKDYSLGFGAITITDAVIIEVPNLTGAAARFGIQGRRDPAGGTGGDFNGAPFVEWDRNAADFKVHGHNKAVDLDDTAGVTYETTGGIVSQFEKIDPGPGGRFLQHFARRLIVFRNFGDSQAMAFSRDGILNDFVGTGSGELALVEARGDTHGDSIDDIMGSAILGSNFMAIFRRRSIWRGFETGNIQLAVGAVSWLENIGTTTPFSICHVRGGAMFLGQDMMVYYLTEAGYTAVGHAIQQVLIETLQGASLDKVDSNYDPTFGEYWLGIPENGAANITKVHIFDVNRFIDKQEFVWRQRAMNVQRFAVASVVE